MGDFYKITSATGLLDQNGMVDDGSHVRRLSGLDVFL